MKSTILLGCFFIAFTISVKAQHKVAYVYSDSLLMMMPETKKIDSIISVEEIKFQKEMESRQQKYMELKKKYDKMVEENGGKEGTGLVWDNCKTDLQEAVKKIQRIVEVGETEITELRRKQYEPVIEIAQKAIAEVAKEQGYTYVLDASIGAILYFSPNDNILADVKKKLGIK